MRVQVALQVFDRDACCFQVFNQTGRIAMSVGLMQNCGFFLPSAHEFELALVLLIRCRVACSVRSLVASLLFNKRRKNVESSMISKRGW